MTRNGYTREPFNLKCARVSSKLLPLSTIKKVSSLRNDLHRRIFVNRLLLIWFPTVEVLGCVFCEIKMFFRNFKQSYMQATMENDVHVRRKLNIALYYPHCPSLQDEFVRLFARDKNVEVVAEPISEFFL